jgi:16S rRNA (cytidine1402-2'-O)-methyltransferase
MGGSVSGGTLYVVSTPIGNLEDITRRAARILGDVDLIAAEDTRTSGMLLKHLGIRKPLVSYHSHNEARRLDSLLAGLHDGKSIAVITDAGTPGISDPAFSLIRGAIDGGIPVVPLPGPTAFVPALVMSGLPMDRFVFEGFLPAKKGRRGRIEALAREERTVVFYESPHRIHRTLREILDAWGDRPAALVREITKAFEEVRRGTLAGILMEISGMTVKGEIVLVVGGYASRRHKPMDTQE